MLSRIVVTGLLVLGVAGCAGLGANTKGGFPQPEARDEVAQLAATRWEALIQGDLAKAYQYLSPGTRQIMSLDLYKAQTRPGSWKKATVDTVTCEQDRCKVIVMIQIINRKAGLIETVLEEAWLQENGRWWYIPRK